MPQPTNIINKLRKREAPYASWTDTETGMQIFLLRGYQVDNAKKYARWHTYVNSEFSEYGDQYVDDLLGGLVDAEDLAFDTELWPDRDAFITWAWGSA